MPRSVASLPRPTTKRRLWWRIDSHVGAPSTAARRMPPQSVASFRSRPNMSAAVAALRFAVVVVLGSLPLAVAATATWNVTCPAPCFCSVQPSEMDHQEARRTVNCSYQSLKSLPSDLPRDAEALLVTGNSLTEAQLSTADLLELKELDLVGNRVRSLGRGYIFHNLSGLTFLNLAKNDLAVLVRDAFAGLVRLRVLIVSSNRIANIHEQAFHGLSSLQVLDLGQNQLSSLYPEWFYGLPSLRELHLHENRVHLVNSATFRVLRRLQHLSLHGNRIGHVATDGFWDLAHLETLHLERNYLQEVPTAALRGLPMLKALYLGGNPLVALRGSDFADLPAIETLVLNRLPNLRLVDAAAFRNLSRLSTLELRDCRALASIDAAAFVDVPVLHRLDLQNDNLSTVPHEVALALPSGCEVALCGNPLHCDCNVRWIRRELELAERNASHIWLSDADRLVCHSPPHIHSIPLRHLDALPAQCAPSILPLLSATVEKRLGDPLALDCRAVGQPPPTVRWTLPDGRNVTLASTANAVDGHGDVRPQLQPSGTLFYRHLTDDDSGPYTCTAWNSEGVAEFRTVVRVKPIDIHLFPDTVSSTYVILVWNGTERNSFPRFHILYQQVPLSAAGGAATSYSCHQASNETSTASFRSVAVSSFHRFYTINGLRPESVYEFCLTFKDQLGYDFCISCTVARTMDADFRQGIYRTSNVAVAVVLGIIVVMVMVICFVTVAARKYRQRQYICPDKPIVHRMSHIPLENLYSPLMSNAGP